MSSLHALTEAILDGRDEGAWAVLADHLQSIGDVRGELWALEAALARSAGPARLPLVHRRNDVLADGAASWMLPLLEELDREPGPKGAHASELAALRARRQSWSELRHLPQLFLQQRPDIQLAWRAGFIVAARVRGSVDRLRRLLSSTLSCPAAILLGCLDIDVVADGFPEPESMARLIQGLGDTALETPARGPGSELGTARHLRVRAHTARPWKPDWVTGWAPNLRRLSLFQAEFSGFRHPRVERLQVAGERADRLLGSLGHADLPALHSLAVGPFDAIADDGGPLGALLEGAALPALTTLRLARLQPEIEQPLLDALLHTPLFLRLRHLELEWLRDRPGTRAWLHENRSSLGHLTIRDIREHGELFCGEL